MESEGTSENRAGLLVSLSKSPQASSPVISRRVSIFAARIPAY